MDFIDNSFGLQHHFCDSVSIATSRLASKWLIQW